MTICISIKVSEGLVLAADSSAAVQGWIGQAGGEPQILKTYEHAGKLAHIKDYPIGTLNWGTSLIGSRSVASLIKEFEYSLPSLDEENEKIKERRMRGESQQNNRFPYNVHDIAKDLIEHVTNFYHAEIGEQATKPSLGILVSGFSSEKFFPEQWLLDIPNRSEPVEIRPDVEGKPSFGANWFGLTDAIVRLHHGRDDRILLKISEKFGTPIEEAQQLLADVEYPVLFDGMPLQDAVDYAVYLVNVVIGRFRFVIGAPLCGGDIDVAVITPNTFSWVQRKSWKVKTNLSGK
jgi:hypothetical protein